MCSKPTHTRLLAELVLGEDAFSITDSARASARKLVLDSIGCAIAGRNAPGVVEARDQMLDWGGKPESTILLTGKRVPAPHAAFVNGTMIHALDLDDIHIPASLHLMSVVFPAALAAAEMVGASGRDLLDATIHGIEVAARLGNAETKRRRGQGFLPASLTGGFGAVAAASWLLGLSVDQCVQAMGINYAQTSGNRQALYDATLTKRMQPALAARSALWSTALAARGVTGAHNALEGDAGYFKVYLNGDVCAPEELTAPGQTFEIERMVLKHYPSCGASHPTQAAAEQLVWNGLLRPDDIRSVMIFGLSEGGMVSRPFVIGDNPQVAAQFSVRYAVALTLLRGPAKLCHFTDEAVLADHEVADLAQRVTFGKAPDGLPEPDSSVVGYGRYYTDNWCGVVVETTDGRTLVGYELPARHFAPGGPDLVFAQDKFRACAAFDGVFSEERIEEIIQTVDRLDELSSLDPILSLLAG
jgi:2-methylcitrate dehydratase PrpD